LPTRNRSQRCSYVLLVDGFDEIEAITVLGTLRRAGLCVKGVGLTGGLVGGAHGMWLKPDMTFTELCDQAAAATVGVLLLPEGRRCLARLETDPRFQRVVGQVFAGGGRVAAGRAGMRLVRRIVLQDGTVADDPPGLIGREVGQSTEEFASGLVRWLEQSPPLS